MNASVDVKSVGLVLVIDWSAPGSIFMNVHTAYQGNPRSLSYDNIDNQAKHGSLRSPNYYFHDNDESNDDSRPIGWCGW